MALYSGPEARVYPSIPVAADGRVEGFSGGTGDDGEHACFTGIHLIEREVLELVTPGRPCGIVDPIYKHLLSEDLPLHALAVTGRWNEAGTVARYIEAQIDALRREDYPIAFHHYQRVTAGGYKSLLAWYGRAGLETPYMLAEEYMWLTVPLSGASSPGPDHALPRAPTSRARSFSLAQPWGQGRASVVS